MVESMPPRMNKVTSTPSDELSCQEFAELVTEYLEGALDRPTRARFDNHLVDCSDCAAYIHQMKEVIGAVGFIREEDLSPEARDVLMSRFRFWKRGG